MKTIRFFGVHREYASITPCSFHVSPFQLELFRYRNRIMGQQQPRELVYNDIGKKGVDMA